MMRLAAALLLAAIVGGCDWKTFPTSIEGGECKVMTRPPYVVQGKAAYDQNWIDNEIEGGVGACGWKRPEPRPASIDAAPVRKPAVAPAKKKGVIARAKDRVKSIWPAPSAVPSVPLPEPVVVAPVPVPMAPVPVSKPRSAIDELLQPGTMK